MFSETNLILGSLSPTDDRRAWPEDSHYEYSVSRTLYSVLCTTLAIYRIRNSVVPIPWYEVHALHCALRQCVDAVKDGMKEMQAEWAH